MKMVEINNNDSNSNNSSHTNTYLQYACYVPGTILSALDLRPS